MPRAPDLARRVVVTTFGSLGDLHPYLALALGLRARGHDVVVATGKCYRGQRWTLATIRSRCQTG